MANTFDRRAYATEYARKRRHLEWERVALRERKCPHRHGPSRCGAILESFTDGNGRIEIRCPMCARRLAGVCRDCPRPVEGRVGSAVRCREHKALALKSSLRRYAEQNREAICERAKAAYRTNDEQRRRRNEYKKVWRAANPQQVKRHKRREALRQSKRNLTYHKRYNEHRRAEKAEAMREKYRAEHPAPRPVCATCAREIPWSARGVGVKVGRPPKRCVFCDARDHLPSVLACIKRWVASDERPMVTKERPKVRPLRPKHRQPVRYSPAGERFCLTPQCQTFVQGREKKCEPCKAQRFAQARALIGRVA